MDREPEVTVVGATSCANGVHQISLTDLPDLVLMKILNFFTVPERLETETVSKRWRQFVNASLRSCHSLSTKEIIKMIRKRGKPIDIYDG